MNPRRLAPSVLALVLLARAQSAQEDKLGPITLEQAARCFAELAAASAEDGGKLWGVEIDGPVLLLDPFSRRMAANQADVEGKLVAQGGVFVGTLPRDKPAANAPIELWGVRWATVMVSSLGETPQARVRLMAHESFHRVQPQLGLYAFGEENEHLDTLEGRTWLQLEWNALETALLARDEARLEAVRDALDFRAARRARFPDAGAREDRVEIREGLANYTGLRLAGGNAEYVAGYVTDYVANQRTSGESFVRSFAYMSGPLFGYLLDAARDGWRKEVRSESDLGAMLAEALHLEPSAARAAERAAKYDGDAIRAAEEKREQARQARLTEWRASLVEGPVLVLDLSLVSTRTVDTRGVHPFDAGQTVYTERKLIAQWGTLAVSGGAILEDSKTRLGRVSLRDAAADRRSGQGWTLELAAGWTIAPGERAGDFLLKSP